MKCKLPKFLCVNSGIKRYLTVCFYLLLCNCCDSSNLTSSTFDETLQLVDSSFNSNRKEIDVDGFIADEQTQKFACSQTTYVYNTLSSSTELLEAGKLPQIAINGEHLKVCSQGFTCCTEEMETRLLNESRKEYQKSVQDKIVGLSHTFDTRTSKFDKFFRELIANSRRDLHQMFVRTYGLLYEQNSDIFSTLFDDLSSYYIGKQKINLESSVDSFYQHLYKRMFQLLNKPYQFDNSYWDCMARYMEQLKPFGDVPSKMKQQVTRALVAAKTFVNGLSVGRDVVRQIMELPPSNECGSALMRMMFCPHCRGMVDIKPCNNFCLNVMKGCLAYQSGLDREWNEYLDALLNLLERLEGPFNIESVIDPIDVKISDAIMIFQDKGQEITSQIFAGCGNPKSKRRRSIKKKDVSLTDLKFGNPGQSGVRPTTAAGTSLDRLAKDIREKLTLSKDFWSKLPKVLCNDEKVSAPNNPDDADCWNGLAKNKYSTTVVDDGLSNQLSNPEVPVRLGPANNGVNNLTIKLRLISAKLRQAYNGHNVDFRPFKGADTSQQDKGDNTSGDGEIDDGSDISGDSEDGSEIQGGKNSKKLTTLETDDEDLLKEASGDGSGDGPDIFDDNTSTSLAPTTSIKRSRIKSTSITILETTTSSLNFDSFTTESGPVSSYTLLNPGFTSEVTTEITQTLLDVSTIPTELTTTTLITKKLTAPTRQLSTLTTRTTLGRWVPPATTAKPTIYIFNDAKTVKPLSKGNVCRTNIVWFSLLILLSVSLNRRLSCS